ncbi:MAG: hypothetical protein IJU61_09785 [Victivallales bacterium]|nr:hypothetical protein [Bacteroidales bacterium]MBQ9446875.1 hypothetical protein [Victivallales bacterium]
MATTSKLATTLDLSKIKAKELPTSTVKAVLNPEIGEQEFAIHALSDLDRIDISDVISNNRSVSRLSKFYVKMLAAGLDVLNGSEEDARELLDKCTEQAMIIANAIFALTNQFNAAKADEKAEAEKN